MPPAAGEELVRRVAGQNGFGVGELERFGGFNPGPAVFDHQRRQQIDRVHLVRAFRRRIVPWGS